MDPKMDSGMALQINPTYTAEECYRADLIPKDTSLSTSQIILLMDQVFQSEICFYSGQNLIQTIFTCLYIHDLQKLNNPYLLVYFYATLKSCSLMREMVLSTDIVDEEDFNGIIYGFRLLDDITKDQMLYMINLAESDLSEKIKKAKGEEITSFVLINNYFFIISKILCIL